MENQLLQLTSTDEKPSEHGQYFTSNGIMFFDDEHWLRWKNGNWKDASFPSHWMKPVENWINVDDRLPIDMDEILFTNVNIKDLNGNPVEPMVQAGWYNKGFFSFVSQGKDRFTATYWKPMPLPPKK